MSATFPPALDLPPSDVLRIVFARSRYDLRAVFDRQNTGIATVEARDVDDLLTLLPSADVLVVGGGWKNAWLPTASRLRFVQSISSGTNQFDLDAFRARHIALASAQGVNTNAVSDHAMGLLLALARQLPHHMRQQQRRVWHPGPAPADMAAREDELAGKTVLVVGLGAIGDRVARLARAFDMQVLGVRRDPDKGGSADEIHGFSRLPDLLPRADAVVLCCPLTQETRHLIDARTVRQMKPGAWLVNVARGGCVDEPVLIDALAEGRIAGAALDVADPEPLAQNSPLWTLPNVLVTPHRACETRRYEENLLSILLRNLGKLRTGDPALVNRVV